GGPSSRQDHVSPFEADRARKGRSFEPELSVAPQTQPQAAVAVAVAAEEPQQGGNPAAILGRVLDALEKTPNADNLIATLSEGVVSIQGNELIVTVSQPASVVQFLISTEQKQIANAAATAAAGYPLRLNIVGGAKKETNGAAVSNIVRSGNGASARSRAAEDPVVQR